MINDRDLRAGTDFRHESEVVILIVCSEAHPLAIGKDR